MGDADPEKGFAQALCFRMPLFDSGKETPVSPPALAVPAGSFLCFKQHLPLLIL